MAQWGPGAARVQRVQKVQRVQRVWYRLTAMSIKTALRDLVLYHQCCRAKCVSLLPQEGGGAVRRRRIGASGLFSYFRTYPQGFAQLLSEKGAYVTGFALMSPVLQDEVLKPPSIGRGRAVGDGG